MKCISTKKARIPNSITYIDELSERKNTRGNRGERKKEQDQSSLTMFSLS